MAYKQPPSYSEPTYASPYGGNEAPARKPATGTARLNPRTWSRRGKIIVWSIIAIILIVVIIVGAVVGTENSKYPIYSALTYNIADTCMLMVLPSFNYGY